MRPLVRKIRNEEPASTMPNSQRALGEHPSAPAFPHIPGFHCCVALICSELLILFTGGMVASCTDTAKVSIVH